MLRKVGEVVRSNARLLTAAVEGVVKQNKCFLPVKATLRTKYTQHQGVKGLRSRKSVYQTQKFDEEGIDENEAQQKYNSFSLEDRAYDEVACGAMHVTRDSTTPHNVLIIQPFVKWGPKRSIIKSPDDQLKEAEALVRSLPNWQVAFSIKVPLESIDKKIIFGSGKMEELKEIIQEQKQRQLKPLTCVFISKSSLTFAQKRSLESQLHLPIMDRYSVVIQILRLHATSAEARIQVAMAEIPYIWAQARDANLSTARKQGYSLTDTQREILKTREKKLKLELECIRDQRKLLRNKRKLKKYPIVAVVGYTNAGKTSLIKALTNEEAMQPRDQLFATLDVTAHAGVLPCNLEVIYMDTVGFMSDLPTGLIECFVATLEDAMLADVIVHVQDLSHSCAQAQSQHVESTLSNLAESISSTGISELPPIINVGNKIDLISENKTHGNHDQGLKLVSAKKQIGLNELLLEIEKKVLVATGRKKITMRIRNGGDEMAWLYKNTAVVDVREDESNSDQLLMDVVCTDLTLQQFKRLFC